MRRFLRAPDTKRVARRRDPRQSPDPVDRWRAAAGFVVACLLLGTAVVFDPAASDSFRIPKLQLAEILGLASLLPLGIAAMNEGERRREGWNPALVAAVPWLLSVAISVAASRHPEAARDGLWHAAVAAVCLVGWTAGLGRQRLRRLLNFLLVPAALLAVVGLLQVAEVFEPVQLRERAGARFEMVSLAGNVGDLAMYLALPTVIALNGFLAGRGRERAGYGLLLGLFAGSLLFTRTLAVLAAVAFGCFVSGALRLDRRRFAGLALVVILAGGAGWLTVPGLEERTRRVALDFARGHFNSLLSGRLEGWSAAAWMFRQSPLTGVGVGAFATEYTPARLALPVREAGGDPQIYSSFDAAHNDLLQLAAEQGLGGLLALGFGLGVAWRAVGRRRAAGPSGEVALAGGGAATLAVVALGDFPLHLALTAYPALLFVAWTLADAEEGGAP